MFLQMMSCVIIYHREHIIYKMYLCNNKWPNVREKRRQNVQMNNHHINTSCNFETERKPSKRLEYVITHLHLGIIKVTFYGLLQSVVINDNPTNGLQGYFPSRLSRTQVRHGI